VSSEGCRFDDVNLEQLAWAAGLFDGEGSAIASKRADRPGYLRLEATVPQCGHDGLPEVLVRFRAAVAGVGTVTGPDSNDMYVWRASGFQDAQAVIALLWQHLGEVKRGQAATAMRAVAQQYTSGAYRPHAPRTRRQGHDAHVATRPSVATSTDLDLAWAAGFLDGEGHFGTPHAVPRKGGTPWRRIRVSASQHGEPRQPAQVLHRLQRVLGGRIERHGDADDFRWVIESAPTIEAVYALLRPWLGTVKQDQARRVIDAFRSQTRLHGASDRCVRGHEYDHTYMSATGPKRRCNSCARVISRLKRASQGIKPRQFKNVARRYTF